MSGFWGELPTVVVIAAVVLGALAGFLATLVLGVRRRVWWPLVGCLAAIAVGCVLFAGFAYWFARVRAAEERSERASALAARMAEKAPVDPPGTTREGRVRVTLRSGAVVEGTLRSYAQTTYRIVRPDGTLETIPATNVREVEFLEGK